MVGQQKIVIEIGVDAEAEFLAGIPFINMELVDQQAFDHFTQNTFATDRDLVPKGMVEVVR